MVFTVYGKSDLNKVTRIEVPPKNLEGCLKDWIMKASIVSCIDGLDFLI